MLTQIASPYWWPSQCLICHGWPARTICAACIARHDRVLPRCATCAAPVTGGASRCGACLRQPPALDGCLSALPYEWPWTLCVGRLKFHGDVSLGRTLAGIMRSKPELARMLGRAHRVLPVPSSERHLGERGYNPAHLLARALAGRRCRHDLVQRVGQPLPQRGLSRAERLKNPRGTFRVAPDAAAALQGQRLVVVDDVMTTGATLNELARTLKDAGAREVVGLVLARDD